MTTAKRQPRLKFGIQTAQQLVTYEQLKEVWQAADELGFYSAWCHDHFLPAGVKEPVGPCMEGWTMLSALLPQMKRLRGGLFVAGNTYRHPSVMAKAATTLDNITGGRVELGIGAGWFEAEHTAYGIPFYTTPERIHRLDEAVQVIKALWTLAPGAGANFQGKYYQLKDAPMDPPPVQRPHPPIMIGGGGEKLTLRVVAKWADRWNIFVTTRSTVQRKLGILREHCAAVGRNFDSIELTVGLPLMVTGDRARIDRTAEGIAQRQKTSLEDARTSLFAGTPDELIAQGQAWYDLGIREIIIPFNRVPYNLKELQTLAKEVMPAFA